MQKIETVPKIPRPFPFELESRYDFGKMLTAMGLTGNAVEIGVYTGYFSKWLLKTSNFQKLYSVDYWETTDHKQIAIKKLAPFKERSEIIQSKSVVASAMFPDNFFDFIYIDASHNYTDVKNDIFHWWPKLRYGGVFAGHDYENTPHESKLQHSHVYRFEVIAAVNEFIAETGLRLHLTTKDNYNSWYVCKPKHILL